MFSKTLSFEDLDGNTISDTFWFHMTAAEVAELELGTPGGMGAKLQRLVKEDDRAGLLEMFKFLIQTAYGKRSEDNRRFVKTPEVTAEFMQTDAYSALFLELITSEDAAIEFFNGIMPKNLEDKVNQLTAGQKIELPAKPEEKPATAGMTLEDMQKAIADLKSGQANS